MVVCGLATLYYDTTWVPTSVTVKDQVEPLYVDKITSYLGTHYHIIYHVTTALTVHISILQSPRLCVIP